VIGTTWSDPSLSGRFSWTVESTPNASKIEALYQFDNPFSNQIDSRAIVL
jgi:hypothetical protein